MGGRRHRKKGLPSPLYAANSTKFTAVLHHGGFFSNTRSAKYNGKKVDYFDFCDVDEMSIFELVDMVQNLGIKRPVKLFRIALDGAKKILPLCSDGDVMNMLGDLPRNHHVHIFLVEQTFEPQFENELPTKPESEPHVIEFESVDEPHIEAEVEPQIEIDVETEIETEPLVESETEIEPPVGPEIEIEPPAVEPESVVETEPVEPEPSIEPPIGPEIEIETEPPAVVPEPVVETEPVEHEPSIEPEPLVESDESNEFEDYDYNGSVRSESVTSEFDDSDFSVEDMSQFNVDAGIDFEGVIGGNSQLNRISSVHPQTQPSRGRTIPKLPVKRPFRGIRIQDATSIPSEQVPHHHRPSTQPPPITVVRMMMNSGNNSMSQPTTATSNFPPNDQ
ncbi:hypothetical protein V6N12_062742 [Hibiscus sabdariffa]|uniref:PB1-like domain-containing protein n=1 Tax=Hibiscus sabdariffa TaxID=183260 RepID=A0ABR2F9Q8_9ROSI